MAEPVGFEVANLLISGEVIGARDLPAFRSDYHLITCWRLTPEELEKVAQTGVVWLTVLGQHPAMMISGNALVKIGDRDAKAEPIIPSRANCDQR